MDFQQFIAENYLILVPVLWIIGTFLKKSPKVPDWTIPWVVLVLGVAGSVATQLNVPTINAIIQGVLVAGGAVLGHELIKQSLNRDA